MSGKSKGRQRAPAPGSFTLLTPINPHPQKVESYMSDVISKMRGELRGVLKAAVAAYPGTPRDKWLFQWPSQIILVVNQIFWCQEVEQVGRAPVPACSPEAAGNQRPPKLIPQINRTPHKPRRPQAFADLAKGKAGAMKAYNDFQVKQLTRLIEVTRTNLPRADRQKVRRGGGVGWGDWPAGLVD
jgi:dynein heavy chain